MQPAVTQEVDEFRGNKLIMTNDEARDGCLVVVGSSGEIMATFGAIKDALKYWRGMIATYDNDKRKSRIEALKDFLTDAIDEMNSKQMTMNVVHKEFNMGATPNPAE